MFILIPDTSSEFQNGAYLNLITAKGHKASEMPLFSKSSLTKLPLLVKLMLLMQNPQIIT